MVRKIVATVLLGLASAGAFAQQITVPWGFHTTVSFPDKTFDFAYSGETFSLQSFSIAETTFDFDQACGLPGPGAVHGTNVTVSGLLASAKVFSFQASARCPAGSFSDALNPSSGALVDEVVFAVPGLSGVIGQDLVITVVPEPETFVLLLAGLALLIRRRRADHRL